MAYIPSSGHDIFKIWTNNNLNQFDQAKLGSRSVVLENLNIKRIINDRLLTTKIISVEEMLTVADIAFIRSRCLNAYYLFRFLKEVFESESLAVDSDFPLKEYYESLEIAGQEKLIAKQSLSRSDISLLDGLDLLESGYILIKGEWINREIVSNPFYFGDSMRLNFSSMANFSSRNFASEPDQGTPFID